MVPEFKFSAIFLFHYWKCEKSWLSFSLLGRVKNANTGKVFRFLFQDQFYKKLTYQIYGVLFSVHEIKVSKMI